MTGTEALVVMLAGLAGGTINTVVGSGTLITFPVLLALGLPPVTANVSNTLGLLPGSISGAIGYRRELAGQRKRLIRLGSASVLGGTIGALLLLALPSTSFEAVVPFLIIGAVILVLLQPILARYLARRGSAESRHPDGGAVLWVGVLLAGIYGGYFGAAQGVILLGIMGLLLADNLQHINGAKNVLAGLVNGVAAVIFIFAADIDWAVAGLLAIGSVIGGQVGSKFGRKLSPTVLRALIVVVGGNQIRARHGSSASKTRIKV